MGRAKRAKSDKGAAKSAARRAEVVREIIEVYFEALISGDPAAEKILKRAPSKLVRAALLDRLRSDYLFGDSAFFASAFSIVGLGDEGDALCSLVLDRDASIGSRATALTVIGLLDPPRMSILEQVDEESRDALVLHPFAEMVRMSVETADNAEIITKTLREASSDERRAQLAIFRDLRQKYRVPAFILYSDAVADPRLADVREEMLEAIVAEPSLGALDLLERLVHHNPDERPYRSAATRIRTALHEGARAASDATCIFSVYGPGDWSLVSVDRWLDDHEGEEQTRLVLVATEDQTVRGYVMGSDSVLKTVLSVPNVTVRPEVLAALLEMLATDPVAEDDPITAAAFALIRNVPRAEQVALPDPAPDSAGLDELFERPELEGWAWPADLLNAAAVDFPDDDSTDAWQESAVAALRDAGAPRMIASACDMMAAWYVLAGQEAEARLILRAGTDAEERFTTARLPRLLLERCLEMLEFDDEGDEYESDDYDDFLQEKEEDGGARVRKIVLEVVDNQLRSNDPPEVSETLARLMAEGHSRDEARHLIASVMGTEIFTMLQTRSAYDNDEYVARLRRLPEVD